MRVIHDTCVFLQGSSVEARDCCEYVVYMLHVEKLE
jgi:hypothetical protein